MRDFQNKVHHKTNRYAWTQKEHQSINYDVTIFQNIAENNLHHQFIGVQDDVSKAIESQRYFDALQSLGGLKDSIDTLFDSVMIMDNDEALRNNRLSLLRSIADQFRHVADFTMLSTES